MVTTTRLIILAEQNWKEWCISGERKQLALLSKLSPRELYCTKPTHEAVNEDATKQETKQTVSCWLLGPLTSSTEIWLTRESISISLYTHFTPKTAPYQAASDSCLYFKEPSGSKTSQLIQQRGHSKYTDSFQFKCLLWEH